ncbi:MAG: hypothetical protein V4719_21385, partial [Planctomycetota bacterium]
ALNTASWRQQLLAKPLLYQSVKLKLTRSFIGIFAKNEMRSKIFLEATANTWRFDLKIGITGRGWKSDNLKKITDW